MKKIIITTLIIVLSVCFIGTIGMLESTYTRDVIVVSIKDQEITVVMNDKHTGIITDDEILRVKS